MADQEDLPAVRDLIVQQAKHFLTEAGEFYPFGAVMKADGSLVPLAAHNGEEQPASKELIDMLERGIRQQLSTKTARVGGIGVDIRLRFSADTPPTDAVHIRLLRQDGYAVDYIMTYRLAEDRLICDPLFEDEGSLTLE